MAGSLKWDGDKVQAAIRREMAARIASCCSLVMKRAKELLSVAGTMKSKDVEERAGHDKAFAARFNRNRATTSIKGVAHHARLKRGKLVYRKKKDGGHV